MKSLKISLLLLLITLSCNSIKEAIEIPTQNINRVWMLIEYKEFKKSYFVAKKAFLDLTNKDNASANMGCIALALKFSIKKNNSITFSHKIPVKMKCQDMKLDIDFSKSITSITSFSINAHKLILTSNNGETMVFVAQDWD